MRIPSQFNEDSLYRRGNRRGESAQTYRRLLRLVIGLALVVVIMRQASRPAVYQTFFGPQAATLDADEPSQLADSTREPHHSDLTGATTAPIPIDAEDRRIAIQLTEDLPPREQRSWVVGLSQWQSGHRAVEVPTTIELIRTRLAELENVSDEQRLKWNVMLNSFAAQSTDPSPPTSLDQPRLAALLDALDEAAAERVVDGSVWRSGDFDTFYRYLDQANRLSGDYVAVTGVLPLLQQPDVFRNQRVRVHGSVARAERIEARENPYDIVDYWQLWLRPADGADRPIVVIVPTVPSAIGSVGSDAIVQEGPQVIVIGRFLKRLAYESAMGADLAPVVVGRIASAPVAQPDRIRRETSVTSSNRFWIVIALASLIGFAIAAVTMWRTSVMAKRARVLRTAHRAEPNDFLLDLGNSTDLVEKSHEENNPK